MLGQIRLSCWQLQITEQCPYGLRIILSHTFQWNLRGAERPVLEPVTALSLFGIVGTVIQLDGKKYPEVFVADHEVHMLLGDEAEIFHVAALAGNCHQIFETDLRADQATAAVCFLPEQTVELLLASGKDWACVVRVAARVKDFLEQEEENGQQGGCENGIWCKNRHIITAGGPAAPFFQ